MKYTKIKTTNQKKNTNKKNVLLLLAAMFIAMQIFITIQTAVSGSRLAALEKRKSDLIEENKELGESLVGNVSLSALNSDAEDLGFEKPREMLYVGGDEVVARLP